MRRPWIAALAGALGAGAFLAAGCADDARSPEEIGAAAGLSPSLVRAIRGHSPLPALPPDPTNRVADDPEAALLGQALFFDASLSANGLVSCATCHDPERGFTDGRSLAVGIAEGRRKTPTLWNAAHHRWLTWDGRADSLWMQALDPLEDPVEMGFTRGAVARRIATDPRYRELYEGSLGPLPAALPSPDGIPDARPARRGETGAPDHVSAWRGLDGDARAAIDEVFVGAGKALAAYQRRLVRGDAPFDRFVAALEGGDPAGLDALSPAAKDGMRLFFGRASCTLCHSGPNFSDSEFHNNQLPTLAGGDAEDAGRYDGAEVVKESPFNAAGPHSDDPDSPAARAVTSLRRSSEAWGEFRTPSLRNLGGRAPFMHQGQLPTLDAVLRFYSTLEGATVRSHHQEQVLVPLRLSKTEERALGAFLTSLEGSAPDPALLGPPDLDSDAPTAGPAPVGRTSSSETGR